MNNNGNSFILMIYRSTCFNSNLRKVVVNDWMNDYNVDVYGVDVDTYGIPSWVSAKLKTNSIPLPVICIVDNKKVQAFPVR